MNIDRWNVLSGWHNDWLAATAEQRLALRSELASQHPELVDAADAYRYVRDAAARPK